jgi:uncharacterized membrane protein
MDTVIATLKASQLHPVADHFTVAILIVAVLADLAGSLMPTRTWIRYMALSLVILGAIAAWSSNLTGGWEADRLAKQVTGPAKEVLEWHEEMGDYLPWVFTALALWRIGVQALGFVAGSRPLYLIVGLLAVCALGYQGHEGGVLVYDYGVGTALMPSQAPSPVGAGMTEIPEKSAPLPTVFVATPTPASTPAAPSSTPAAPSASTPTAATASTPTAAPSVTPSAIPSATPTASVTPSAGSALNTRPGLRRAIND